MRIEPEMGGCSIVLLGNFNPAIFSPQWFARYEIVSQQHADEAQISIIHPEVANFSLGGTGISVEVNRFNADTGEAPWVKLYDLVVKTFGEVLTHTPISQLGINRLVHFGVGSEVIRNKIGRVLAPTSAWGEWGEAIDRSSPELRGGFSTLTMQEIWKDEKYKGRISARVEPSTRISGNSGIFVEVNHHCELAKPQPSEGADPIISFLIDRFSTSITRSEWIIDQLMKLKEDVEP